MRVPSPSLIASLNSISRSPSDRISHAYACTWSSGGADGLQNLRSTKRESSLSTASSSTRRPIEVDCCSHLWGNSAARGLSSSELMPNTVMAAVIMCASVTSKKNSSLAVTFPDGERVTLRRLMMLCNWYRLPPSIPEEALYKRFQMTYSEIYLKLCSLTRTLRTPRRMPLACQSSISA